MLTPCSECSHALWSEERHFGALRFVVYFDDEEDSKTYAEQVRVCPECGAGLVWQAQVPHERVSRPRRSVAFSRTRHPG